MNTLIFFLAGAGATQIVCFSKLFRWLRAWLTTDKLYWNLDSFFTCPLCVGFWVGVWFSFCFFLADWPLPCDDHPLASQFIHGCAMALVAYVLAMVVGDEGIRVNRDQC